MLDAVVNNDQEAAKAAFHNYTVAKSKSVFEMAETSTPVGGEGTADPKKAQGKKEHNTTDKDEIKAGKGSKNDPKSAKSSNEVTGTLKSAAKEDIKKSGESVDDPTKAKGSKEVKATVAKAAKDDITKATK